MPKNDEQVAALKRHIETFFARHGLTTFAWLEGRDVTEEQAAQGGEKTYFMMGFDSEVYKMFWPLPDIEVKEIMRSRSLRKTFDDIVAKHGFWTEFDDITRVAFMSVEDTPPKRESETKT